MTDQGLIDRWEGKDSWKENLGNRVSGLAMLVFGAIMSTTDNVFLDIGAYAFMTEELEIY